MDVWVTEAEILSDKGWEFELLVWTVVVLLWSSRIYDISRRISVAI